MTIPLPPIPGDEISESVFLSDTWFSWFNQLYTYVTGSSKNGGGIVPITTEIQTQLPLVGGGKIVDNLTLSVGPNSIGNSFLAVMPTGTIKGNFSSGAEQPADLNSTQVKAILNIIFGDISGIVLAAQFPVLTGDITTVGGSLNTTFAKIPANSMLGNNGASLGSPTALTGQQVFTLLNILRSFKSAASSLTSVIALTPDVSLSVNVISGATYKIDIFLSFWEDTTSDGGFQFDLNGGTATVSNVVWGVDGFTNASYSSVSATNLSTAQQYTIVATSSTAPSWVKLSGSVTFSSAGTFSVRWAQNTSSVNPTHVGSGSYILLQPLS